MGLPSVQKQYDLQTFCIDVASRLGPMRLMEGFGNHGVLQQDFEGDDLEGRLVRCFKNDRAGGASALHLKPARGADTPVVAGLEAGEAVLWHGCGEIVAQLGGDGEKVRCDDAADGMNAEVFRAGAATAVAVEAGHGLASTGFKRLAEDILLVVRLLERHRPIVVRLRFKPFRPWG